MKSKNKYLLAGTLLCLGIAAQLTVMRLLKQEPRARSLSKFSSIVRLVRDNKTFCTGTVVSENLIITAAHCVSEDTSFGMFVNPERIEIRPKENVDVGVSAYTVFASPQMDQAMLTGKFTIFETRPFISNPGHLSKYAVKDTRLISCGYPLNGDLYCNETTFNEPLEFFWSIKGILLPGMSGGPTMLPDGTILAVNVAVTKNLSIVSPIYNITKNIPRKEK